MKLRIGHLSTFYHTAILLMADKEISGELGAEVEWRLFGTGPAIVNAFEKDELDLAYIGLPPAIIGIARGVRIKCIAGGHMEGTVIAGPKRFMGFPETDDIETVLRQFIGLKIGVPGKGSIHDVIIKQYLERYHLGGEIEIINFQWADLVTEAVVKGDVQAAVGTPALAAAVIRYADGRLLVPPSMIWPNNPSYGIVASNGLIKTEPELLERFLLLHENAAAVLRERPDAAAGVISSYVGFVDRAFVSQVLGISPRYCAQLTDEYIACAMEFVKTLQRLGYIGREVSSSEIFDHSLIRKIHPEKDHYRVNKDKVPER